MNISTANTEARQTRLDELRRRDHKTCMICGRGNATGLRLDCRADDDGSVAGRFSPAAWMCGYDRQVHGGILCSLMDSAMVQCLFAQGCSAVTAMMKVRFRHPAGVDDELTVTGRMVEHRRGLHRLTAQILRGNCVIAEAEATFVDR